MKLWVASAPAPLCAVNVIGNDPPALGVPLSNPVAALNVTPVGKAPLSLSVGVGKPVAVTVNEPPVSTRNMALFALVIAGGEVDCRIEKGEKDVTLPQMTWFTVSTEVVTFTHVVPL